MREMAMTRSCTPKEVALKPSSKQAKGKGAAKKGDATMGANMGFKKGGMVKKGGKRGC